MDATDTGYGFSMNGIQPIGTITTGNRYFVKLNKSMNVCILLQKEFLILWQIKSPDTIIIGRQG